MRILMAGKFVPTGRNPIGGLQSWIRTVRAEFERMGHQVEEWQPGMPISGRFDLGILANLALTGAARDLCARTTCVSHGIIPAERPGDADRVLFVSEGVRAHWKGTGGIIRQPIDLDFWRPSSASRSGAVRFSYRASHTLCAEAAAEMGMTYRHVRAATPAEARDILAGAALVFASGRAALEAMACGAPTVIYDHRSSYQGRLMDTDLPRQMANSYSGRGGSEPDLAALVAAAEAATPGREWVERHHDAQKIATSLIW